MFQGSEFYNRRFLRLLNDLDIHYYSIYSDRKCSIVERFNRTLKTRMWRYFSAKGTYKWIDVVQDLVDGYNNSKHRSIKMTPNQVNSTNEAEVRSNLFPPTVHTRELKKFKVGDTVRIARKKGTFEKGYKMTYGFEVFKISDVKDTYPLTYGIKDYDGEISCAGYYNYSRVCGAIQNPQIRIFGGERWRGEDVNRRRRSPSQS